MSTSSSNVQPSGQAPARSVLHRDLSIAVSLSMTVQQIMERVDTVIGAHRHLVESAQVLSQSPYLELSSAARRRLGISPQQQRVVLRLILSGPQGALTSVQADEVRDDVHAALHEGSVSTWSSRLPL